MSEATRAVQSCADVRTRSRPARVSSTIGSPPAGRRVAFGWGVTPAPGRAACRDVKVVVLMVYLLGYRIPPGRPRIVTKSVTTLLNVR